MKNLMKNPMSKKLMAFAFVMLVFSVSMYAQSGDSVVQDLKDVNDDTITPILNVIFLILCGVAGAVWGIMALLKHRDALKYGGYTLAGAIGFRILSGILMALAGIS